MDSNHFFLILMDVEGNLLDSNKIFKETVEGVETASLSSYLSESSCSDFANTLDELLSCPKQKQHLLLELKGYRGNSKVWIEFSVITNLDMDLLGVVGIGIDFQFLKQEIPLENLSDLLGLSSILLDKDFCVIEVEDVVRNWLGIEFEDFSGKRIFESELGLEIVNNTSWKSFLVGDESSQFLHLIDSRRGHEFTGLLVRYKKGYQLFLLPKMKESFSLQTTKPFSETQLTAIPGSVWVVDSDMKLIQQNNAGKVLSESWSGSKLLEGAKLQFTSSSSRFSQLKENVRKCLLKGISSEIELNLKLKEGEFGFWKVIVKPVLSPNGDRIAALIQAIDISAWGNKLVEIQNENKMLKELALKPSHVLRSPLSSMLGLLDLIDPHQLDIENQKYFSYLKPLAKELDDVIRTNAKKMSVFD
ncbi:hypothetical protein JYB62_01310 [Algoriphagus lutimaris]|uniref:hypothetical protein n=1 Tax=Algoriphagus lutimaris TaxID=613197 RepID=UPI00196B992A|nr:hypothetical protein [Algoriphagus lutimaris]MBN3518623.1 hypothetical protein [Algoriphagus lutimaris]